jgi:phage tail-like protein
VRFAARLELFLRASFEVDVHSERVPAMYKAVTVLGVLLVLLVGIGQSVSNKRAYVAGKFALELDGIATSFSSCPEGGDATADVVEEKQGADGLSRKHIAGVKYEDISISCGTGMSKGFYEWVKSSFDRKYARKNGAIIAADFDYKELSRRDFSNALISEIGFPALDASSKDAAKMTIKFSPESTRYKAGSGSQLKFSDPKIQKKWLPANFRLKIDGLDCTRVNKIEAITVKQKNVENPLGEIRGLEPASIEFPNLVITLPDAFAKEFYDWHEDFVIKGNAGQESEKGGSLEYLTPDLKTALFTLTFRNLGIFKLSPEKCEASSDQVRRVKAEMYCEEMTFQYQTGIVE